MLAASVQRRTLSAAAALIELALIQHGAIDADRWSLIGGLSRNFDTDFGFGTGMSFSTPMSVESGSLSEDTVVVHLWGVIATGDPTVIEVLASVSLVEPTCPR